jgi:hypothetical protein
MLVYSTRSGERSKPSEALLILGTADQDSLEMVGMEEVVASLGARKLESDFKNSLVS